MLLKQQPVKPMQIVNSNNLRQRTRARTTTRDKMTATTTATTASMAQGLTTTSMESIRNGRTNNQQTSATRLFSTAVGGIDSMMDDGDSVNNNSDVQGEFISSNVPEIHPEQPFLHKIPSGVFPTYRPLPLLAQFLVLILSMWVSAVTTWKRLSWLQPLAILQGWRQPPAVKDLVLFATKALLLTLCTKAILQELFLPPSRLSMKALQSKFFLPSSLSKYEKIRIPIDDGGKLSNELGVHYLRYENQQSRQTAKFDAVYVYHGFGASSLSWLPALPPLVERLGARVGLGHDAVGFGFTDRPEDDIESFYTTLGSSKIALELLRKELNDDDQSRSSSVAIFGHSLGSLAALKTALQLPRHTSKFIVLAAPALGLRQPRNSGSATNMPQQQQQQQKKSMSWLRHRIIKPVGRGIQRRFVYPFSGYILRRVVGFKNSWKLGLQSAWGDPEKVTESDVLRFQWPSIGRGWERGLLTFASVQTSPGQDELDRIDDTELLRQVLALPNTKVAIILGSKDKVIPTRSLRNVVDGTGYDVPFIELEGLGHDAFEEGLDVFLETVESLLPKDDKQGN